MGFRSGSSSFLTCLSHNHHFPPAGWHHHQADCISCTRPRSARVWQSDRQGGEWGQQRGACGGRFRAALTTEESQEQQLQSRIVISAAKIALETFPMGRATTCRESRHVKEYICRVFNRARAKSIYVVRKPSITPQRRRCSFRGTAWGYSKRPANEEKLAINKNESVRAIMGLENKNLHWATFYKITATHYHVDLIWSFGTQTCLHTCISHGQLFGL